MRVEGAATEVRGRLVFGAPKSYEARTVIVPRFVIDAVQPRLEGKDEDARVFTAPRGGPVRLNNFRRRVFGPAAERIGTPGLVPHDVRDTAASLAISSGASIKAVQTMLAHASAKMTLDVYGSLFEEYWKRWLIGSRNGSRPVSEEFLRIGASESRLTRNSDTAEAV